MHFKNDPLETVFGKSIAKPATVQFVLTLHFNRTKLVSTTARLSSLRMGFTAIQLLAGHATEAKESSRRLSSPFRRRSPSIQIPTREYRKDATSLLKHRKESTTKEHYNHSTVQMLHRIAESRRQHPVATEFENRERDKRRTARQQATSEDDTKTMSTACLSTEHNEIFELEM
jgi:hypothetical protein